MTTQIRSLGALAAIGLLMTLGPRPIAAQGSPFSHSFDDGRIPVTIVLSDAVSEPTILRRSSSEHRNIILLSRNSLTPQSLSNAVFGLLVSEARDPEGRNRGDNTAQRSRLSAPAPVFSWSSEAIERLKASQPRPIPGAGRHPSVVIWLTPLATPGVVRQ
jgi:hypothetical protein